VSIVFPLLLSSSCCCCCCLEATIVDDVMRYSNVSLLLYRSSSSSWVVLFLLSLPSSFFIPVSLSLPIPKSSILWWSHYCCCCVRVNFKPSVLGFYQTEFHKKLDSTTNTLTSWYHFSCWSCSLCYLETLVFWVWVDSVDDYDEDNSTPLPIELPIPLIE